MSQKKKTTAQSKRPRKAPSNQTGGTAWGKKAAAAISGKMQSADMKKADPAEFSVHHRLLHGGESRMAVPTLQWRYHRGQADGSFL